MKSAIEEYEGMDPSQQAAYFAACCELMDDSLREELHSYSLSEEEFLREYCARHLAKFSEVFVVN